MRFVPWHDWLPVATGSSPALVGWLVGWLVIIAYIAIYMGILAWKCGDDEFGVEKKHPKWG